MPTIKSKPLADLLPGLNARSFALVGASPSLDYCEEEIRSCIEKRSLFVLADSVAAGFIKKFGSFSRVIFSVENRRHGYLRSLENEDIALYQGANYRNLRQGGQGNRLFHFHLVSEEVRFPSTMLVSPGTVMGCALAFVLFVILQKKLSSPEINLFGIDLAYIDNQVYSKYVHYWLGSGRFKTREGHEYLVSLKKSSQFEAGPGFVVKSSHELIAARENMAKLLDTVKFPLSIVDYSPLGIQHRLVRKVVPMAIEAADH